MEEIWKDILNCKGLYQASTLGRIKSINYNHTKKEKILTPVKHKNGYLFVTLYGKQKSIHRIIAETFIPNLENKPQVNHINGKKDDNRIENLEWVSASENMKHAVENNLINYNSDLMKQSNLKNIIKANEQNKIKINQYDKNGKYINTYNSIIEASKKTNSNATHISLCAKGKQKTCGGFIWRYIDNGLI